MKKTKYTLIITNVYDYEFDEMRIVDILGKAPEFEHCVISVRKQGFPVIEICTIDESDLSDEKKREHCELTLICDKCEYCDLELYKIACKNWKELYNGKF